MPSPSHIRISADDVAYLIPHLVLPPKLPSSDDYNPHHERVLLQTILNALEEYQLYVDDTVKNSQLQSVLVMVKNLMDSRDSNGSVSESQLVSMLAKLNNETFKDVILVEIKAQNAGIFISRCEESIVFETFELSPTNREVIEAKGRLVRSFPANAAVISVEKLRDLALRTALAHGISKMAWQSAPGFQPQIRKAEQDHDEIRDTTHPGMVTNWLMNVISALGRPINPSIIWKNTREDVLWSGGKQPWRRSPLWLLLRVSMQLRLSRASSDSSNNHLYKSFMVFLLSKILGLAIQHSKIIGAETLHAISAKLSRRIKKLETLSPDICSATWMNSVRVVMSDTHNLISEKWNQILSNPLLQVDVQALEQAHPENELDINIPELNRFIEKISVRQQTTGTSTFQPTDEYSQFTTNDLPSGFNALGEYQYFRLAGLERWVELHLDKWLERHIKKHDTNAQLHDLIRAYHRNAESMYVGLPASMSIMYLTIMEIWVACDKSACHIHPLLCDYDSEIPVKLFQSLLLPLKDQMRRLHNVENYVRSRDNSAKTDAPSLFRNFGHPSSFAVRYFDTSSSHQELLSRIERDAANKKRNKCIELANKKQEYRSYMTEYDQISNCDYVWVTTNWRYDIKEEQHADSCGKCYWKKRAEALNIDIYEWPLPSNQHRAKSTVFELDVPEAYGNWRDATAYLLKTVFEFEYQQSEAPSASYTLQGDDGLAQLFSQAHYKPQRVILLSQVKPHTGTHRKTKGMVT